MDNQQYETWCRRNEKGSSFVYFLGEAGALQELRVKPDKSQEDLARLQLADRAARDEVRGRIYLFQRRIDGSQLFAWLAVRK